MLDITKYFLDPPFPDSRQDMVLMIRNSRLRVLDVGCHFYDSGIAIQIRDLPFKELVGFDVVKNYVLRVRPEVFAAETKTFFEGDVRNIDTFIHDTFDIVTMFDILEHLTDEEAISVLKKLEKIATNRVIIFSPIEEKFRVYGDEATYPSQRHMSFWTKEKMETFGYEVDVFEKFHESGDGAFIAIKKI